MAMREENNQLELVIKHYSELTLDELYELLRVRVAVFVVEQNCPYQEIDGKDGNAYHIFFRDSRGIEGCCRVFPDPDRPGEAWIGRVVTLLRRQGLATRLLTTAIGVARNTLHAKHISLEAQTYAKPLYEKVGFRQVSEPFLEDGIPHIQMRLDLDGE